MTKLSNVTELTGPRTLHPLPLMLSEVVEADELTMAQMLHPLPLVLSMMVEAD